jgi:hypothetical protein
MQAIPLNATRVLGLLVAFLIPATSAATLLSSDLAWYHGLGLFYAALGAAELIYLLLLALQGAWSVQALEKTVS